MPISDLAESWSVQPIAITATAAAAVAYWRGVRALGPDRNWPVRRGASLAVGATTLILLTCGPTQYYGEHLFWVWLTQNLTLLLVIPVFLMASQPIELAQRTAPRSKFARSMNSAPVRVFSSPVIGPALIPLASAAVLFGSIPGWAVQWQPVNWVVQFLVLTVGCAIVMPLVATGDTATSMAVGAAVAVGFVELLIDAVPGLVMRLSTHPVSSYFAHRTPLPGQPGQLRDQQLGGAILWIVAELVDLPFLGLIFVRWLRADAREAAEVDAHLDAATSRQASVNNGQTTDEPWFLTDPRLRDRLR